MSTTDVSMVAHFNSLTADQWTALDRIRITGQRQFDSFDDLDGSASSTSSFPTVDVSAATDTESLFQILVAAGTLTNENTFFTTTFSNPTNNSIDIRMEPVGQRFIGYHTANTGNVSDGSIFQIAQLTTSGSAVTGAGTPFIVMQDGQSFTHNTGLTPTSFAFNPDVNDVVYFNNTSVIEIDFNDVVWDTTEGSIVEIVGGNWRTDGSEVTQFNGTSATVESIVAEYLVEMNTSLQPNVTVTETGNVITITRTDGDMSFFVKRPPTSNADQFRWLGFTNVMADSTSRQIRCERSDPSGTRLHS